MQPIADSCYMMSMESKTKAAAVLAGLLSCAPACAGEFDGAFAALCAQVRLSDAARAVSLGCSKTARTNAFRANRQAAQGGRRSGEALRSRSTTEQLRNARDFSVAARDNGLADSSRGFAADAFDQISSANQAAATIATPGADALPPLGAGAPDLTSPSRVDGRAVAHVLASGAAELLENGGPIEAGN